MCCYIDPPDTTITEVTDTCTNDFTVSWTAASDEEGLSYSVILFLDGVILVPVMDNSQSFTDLMPNTTYNVSVASRFNTCVGNLDTMLITTLALEAGLPQSELIMIMSMYFKYLYYCNVVNFLSEKTCMVVTICLLTDIFP